MAASPWQNEEMLIFAEEAPPEAWGLLGMHGAPRPQQHEKRRSLDSSATVAKAKLAEVRDATRAPSSHPLPPAIKIHK